MKASLLTAEAFDTVREDFEGMIRNAWWAAGITTMVGVLAHWSGALPMCLPGILLVGGALQVSSVASSRMAPRVANPLGLYFTAHLVNVVLVTLAIHFAGGIAFLPGPLLYTLIVVNGGIVGSRPAHVLAFACTVAYGTLTGLEVFGVVQPWLDARGPIAVVEPRAWPAFMFIVGAVLQITAAYAGRLAALIRDRQNALVASQLAVRIETERRQLAQAAKEKAERDVADLRDLRDRYRSFVQMVTHDLKNPVNAIYLTADHLLTGADPAVDATTRGALGRIRDMAAGADAMIFDLTDLFRILAKRETSTWVELRDVVHDAISALRDPIDVKHIHIDVPPALPVVWGHQDKILSAVVNLVSNAVKYVSRDTGQIRIFAREDAATHLLTIEDNGIGIPVEYRKRVFDLFARLPDSHQCIDGERATGTGVGLALVRRIMDLHGGGVTIESASPRGTRFELRFPKGTPTEHGRGASPRGA